MKFDGSISQVKLSYLSSSKKCYDEQLLPVVGTKRLFAQSSTPTFTKKWLVEGFGTNFAAAKRNKTKFYSMKGGSKQNEILL